MEAFLKIAKMDGSIAYDSHTLVGYRIHDEALSKTFIDNSGRYKADLEMFEKIRGKKIAKFIMKIYVKAYDIYN